MHTPNAQVALACLFLLLLLFSSATAECGTKSVETRMCDRVDEVRVQLRWMKTGQFAGLYAAEAEGYYTQECLRVVLLERDTVKLSPEEAVLDGTAHFRYSAFSRHLGRPVRIAITDDSYPVHARLMALGVKVCGVLRWSLGSNATCGPDDEVELIWRDFNNGVRNLKLPESDPGFQLEGATLLEDGLCASEEWLAQPGSADITRRFLRATMRGWMYCRDNPELCAQIVTPASNPASRGEALFQIMEVNKLIWPSPEGVGAIIPAEFEAMYRYVAESGMFPEALDPSSSLEPELMNLAIADLKAAGEDVYGQFYSSEQFQDTLTFCRDNATASVTLCKMRCNAGTEPPGTGAIFGAESCMVCEAGSASPGGQAACAPCQAGSVAPSPGMAHCVPDNPTSKALRAGLVAAAALLLLLLVPAWLLWRRSSRLSAELVAMQDGSLDSLNMDAPLVKALGFLREVERGEHNYTWQPWRKESCGAGLGRCA
eukprot:jgi/Tetstr1/441394/TSEL_029642.t1